MRSTPILHTERIKHLAKYCLVAVWMGIIFLLSSEGAHDSKARSGAIVDLLKDSFNTTFTEDFLSFLTRKAAHVITYLVLGILIYSIISTYKFTTKRTIALCILLACFYAIFDEIHQLFVPGRSGEVRDILIDTVAASAGVGTYYIFSKLKLKIHKDRMEKSATN
jgi:VanZ family protein